jgi:fatty acid desaturase
MSDPARTDGSRTLEPVHTDDDSRTHRWTERLVLFLRVMALLSLVKGLYHWSEVIGIVGAADGGFENRALSWQAATTFFAVIDLVAAVGLWLASAWGAVVWLTAVVSMAAVELLFPQVYGGSMIVVAIQGAMLFAYLALAVMAARERPP